VDIAIKEHIVKVVFLLIIGALGLVGCASRSGGAGAEENKPVVSNPSEDQPAPIMPSASNCEAYPIAVDEVDVVTYNVLQRYMVFLNQSIAERFSVDPLADFVETKATISDIEGHAKYSEQFVQTARAIRQTNVDFYWALENLTYRYNVYFNHTHERTSPLGQLFEQIQTYNKDYFTEVEALIKTPSTHAGYFYAEPLLNWRKEQSKIQLVEFQARLKGFQACFSERLSNLSNQDAKTFTDHTDMIRAYTSLLQVYTLKGDVLAGRISKDTAIRTAEALFKEIEKHESTNAEIPSSWKQLSEKTKKTQKEIKALQL
jgi:hypothetical protein